MFQTYHFSLSINNPQNRQSMLSLRRNKESDKEQLDEEDSISPRRVSSSRVYSPKGDFEEENNTTARAVKVSCNSEEEFMMLTKEKQSGNTSGNVGQIQDHYENLPPLRSSYPLAQLNRFMETTNSFLDSFAAKVDERLTRCSNKIDSLENSLETYKKRMEAEQKEEDREPDR